MFLWLDSSTVKVRTPRPEKMSLEEALKSKEAGNKQFKEKNYKEAIQCYNEAIERCPFEDHVERCIFLKNRAACYLKLKQYSNALDDTSAVLKANSGDVKALYRHAQSLEALGQLSEAMLTVQKLLAVSSQNKEGIEMARRLRIALKKQSDVIQSTGGVVKEMFSTLDDETSPRKKKVLALKNLATLSRESSGAAEILDHGGLTHLLRVLESCDHEIVHHTLQVLVGLCTGNCARAESVMESLSLERVSSFVCHGDREISTSAVTLLKHTMLSMTADSASVLPVVQLVLLLLLSGEVKFEVRERIIELLISTCSQVGLGEVYLREGIVGRLLELTGILADGDQDRLSVAVVLSKLHDSLETKELKEKLRKECMEFILTQLCIDDTRSKVNGLLALSASLQALNQIVDDVFNDQVLLKNIVEISDSEDIQCQVAVAEVLSLAASDKSRCQSILSDGLPLLKKLYSSKEDSVKVRALVGLCKLGSVGGSNINARTFSGESVLKLEKACRKFLVNSKKGASIRKWAAEGLAFLSMDAEVKEALISDKEALQVLLSMPKTVASDVGLVFGISTILVNLTNSYDKPEKNPELEELAKYAKENIPEEHEFDAEKYVQKRVAVLLKMPIVPTLVELSAIESAAIQEQVARVFLALSVDQNHRGTIIQQGGAKILVPLSTNNTSKGKMIAAQAIAKIAITNDPKLAFPGQRSLEVVRPLVHLLKSERALQQFEGLMALTNLAGMNNDVRRRILTEGGVQQMESLMFEEHELIRRAATEALSNMIPLEDVHKRFYDDTIERVKLWTLFSGEEDPLLAKAASGGLAQLSHDPIIANKIMSVKSAMEILKELAISENPELQHRGVYIVANLIESSREMAEKFVGSEFLEILMALCQGECSEQVKESAKRALAEAVKYQLIQPNPELTK